MFSDRLPGRLLPVACDSGGNLFCLSLRGDDVGKVIYVDLEGAHCGGGVESVSRRESAAKSTARMLQSAPV